jgi:putative membrane fusion protein
LAKKTNNNRYIKASKSKTNNKKKYKRVNKHISLGLSVYVLIFFYLMFLLLSFLTKDKVNYTIAESGEISEGDVFTGLIIRDESLVKSTTEGEINYFVSEGTRVKKDTYICTVDSKGDISKQIKKTMGNINSELNNSINFDSTSYKYLQEQVRNYIINSNKNKFEYCYSTKNNIEKSMREISNTIIFNNNELESILNNLKMYQNKLNNNINIYQAPISGLVSYNIDGMENLTINNIDYSKVGKKVNSKEVVVNNVVKKDTPLFKIINNYLWYIVVEVNDDCRDYLDGKNYINMYFSDKDLSVDVKIYDVTNQGDRTYAIFEIDRYANEFLTDRIVDLKIGYSNFEGIKIPNSAVTKKEFIKIPTDALIENGRHYGVKKKIYGKNFIGGESIKFIPVDMYFIKEKTSYIKVKDKLNIGDKIIYEKDNNTIEIPLTEKKELDGVYVINKGFAIFKLIDTKHQEKVYRIIENDTPYGVRIYDKIATEASKVIEEQIIN